MWRRLAVLALTLATGVTGLTRDLRGQPAPADSAAALGARAEPLWARRSEPEVRRAIALWTAARPLFAQAGARRDEAETLFKLGRAYNNLGATDSASAALHEAVAIRREVGPPDRLGAALGMLGSVFKTLGLADSALLVLHEARGIQRQAGDRRAEGRSLANLGLVYGDLGYVDSTLHYYRRAIYMLHEARDPAYEAQTLNLLGALYWNLGRTDSAAFNFRRALAIGGEQKERKGQALALGNLGGVYYSARQLDSALVFFRQALALHRELGARQAVAATLDNIAGVHGEAGRLDSALFYARQALDTARAVGDRGEEGRAFDNIATFLVMRGAADSAEGYFARALAIRRELRDRWGEAQTLAHVGWMYLDRRGPAGLAPDPLRASAYLDSAAASFAGARGDAGGDANAISFAEQYRELFTNWTRAWLARRDAVGVARSARASLAVADRSHAQALLDQLRASADRASRGAHADDAATRPGADLAAEGDSLLAPLRRAGATALSYVMALDTVVAWLALPSGEVHVSRVPLARDTLDALLRALRASLEPEPLVAAGRTRGGAGGSAAPNGEAALARLAALLLPADLRTRLPAAGELVIVPQGALALVPFAALPAGPRGEPLGVGHAVRFAPSLAALHAAEARPTPWRASGSETASAARGRALAASLVVGNPTMPAVPGAQPLPPLPAAEREAATLARAVGARALIGGAATESAAWARLPRAPLVHLATHGYAYTSDAQARESWVALAADSVSDGLLTVGELLDDPDLALAADLVVLSACETGLGNLTDAEGTVGLARAFLARGARSVLVSLWNVSDESTELLMRQFYAHWLRDADAPSKAEALRRAQGDVRRTPRFAHPRFWAAFQLVGAR